MRSDSLSARTGLGFNGIVSIAITTTLVPELLVQSLSHGPM